MPQTIYRRHSADCRVHKLKLTTRAKRFYADCECSIWLTGTTDTSTDPRQSTKLRDWTTSHPQSGPRCAL